MYKIFLTETSLNDATSYYVAMIEAALQRRGTQVMRTMALTDICADDVVVVLECASFWKVWRNNRRQKIVLWVQGIFPEETDLTYPKGLKKWCRQRYWRFKERLAIRYAAYILFISDEMRRHYQRVYGYSSENYFIMPCFNMSLDEEVFIVPQKYTRPTFVYAGGLNSWQCIRQTLKAYAAIAECLPDSHLTILTRQVQEAQKMVDEAGLKNVNVRCVPLDQMVEAQKQFKYGFLLREDIEVNRVATPTKLNSYMASGIIPIMSDVIMAFREHLASVKYMIRVQDVEDSEEIAKSVVAMEKSLIQGPEVLADFRSAFKEFYNTEHYVSQLMNKLPYEN